MNQAHRFLEYTLLSIFLWIGLWGAVDLLVEKYDLTFSQKLTMYACFAFVSFYLLYIRDHI